MKRKWYEYLWIASLVYLVLGFFNILFAWLGLLCFFIPLLIAAAGGGKREGEKRTAAGIAEEGAFLACWAEDWAFLGKRMCRAG